MGQYLSFCLAGEEYALPILEVREILDYRPPTAVPASPPWLLGVMDLRGTVVPVIDLSARLGLPPGSAFERPSIVVVETAVGGEPAGVGLVVGAVSEVIQLAAEAVETPPAFGTLVPTDYLREIGNLEDRFVLILDLDRILATREIPPAAPEPPEGEAAAAGRTPSGRAKTAARPRDGQAAG